MSDRQLLEDAAKAAGIKLVFGPYGVPRDCTGMAPAMNMLSAEVWNPIDDDGDALRLAVALGISVSQEKRNGCVFCDANEGKVTADEEFGTDPYAATRRAIVRAAAEIGRSKK
jgi:hypothetical protein